MPHGGMILQDRDKYVRFVFDIAERTVSWGAPFPFAHGSCMLLRPGAKHSYGIELYLNASRSVMFSEECRLRVTDINTTFVN